MNKKIITLLLLFVISVCSFNIPSVNAKTREPGFIQYLFCEDDIERYLKGKVLYADIDRNVDVYLYEDDEDEDNYFLFSCDRKTYTVAFHIKGASISMSTDDVTKDFICKAIDVFKAANVCLYENKFTEEKLNLSNVTYDTMKKSFDELEKLREINK